MDWFKICFDYYVKEYYNSDLLKVFVKKNKITSEQYKEITGIEYVD